MKGHEYRKISTGRGQAIRDLLGQATGDPRDVMGRRELAERLAEIFPEENLAPVASAIGVKFEELARATAAGGDRWNLRQGINALALETVEGIEKLDRIVEPAAASDEDIAAAVEATEDPWTKASRARMGLGEE